VVEGFAWHSYYMIDLAPAYFVGSLVDAVSPVPEDYIQVWFPIPDGKETVRRWYLERGGQPQLFPEYRERCEANGIQGPSNRSRRHKGVKRSKRQQVPPHDVQKRPILRSATEPSTISGDRTIEAYDSEAHASLSQYDAQPGGKDAKKPWTAAVAILLAMIVCIGISLLYYRYQQEEYSFWARPSSEHDGTYSRVYHFKYSTLAECKSAQRSYPFPNHVLPRFGCEDSKPAMAEIDRRCAANERLMCLILEEIRRSG
jgi:hypothetical protein